MPYEVEKRSYIKNKSDYKKCKSYLDKNAKPLKKVNLLTYLFREPNYLRVRIEKGCKKAIITHKSGNYSDPARKEINLPIDYKQLPQFFKLIKTIGFEHCVIFKALRYVYKFKGLHVDLTDYNYLGTILEVEALTNNKKEIPQLKKKVSQALKLIGLKELGAKEYQKMLDRVYRKYLKDI